MVNNKLECLQYSMVCSIIYSSSGLWYDKRYRASASIKDTHKIAIQKMLLTTFKSTEKKIRWRHMIFENEHEQMQIYCDFKI